MSTFVERFGNAKNKSRKKVSVPEHKIRDHQLQQGRDEFDENGLVLRHASQAWHDSYRCWHRYKVYNCSETWDHVKRSKQNSCYWCPKFAEERNNQASLDGVRFIPPAKMSTYCKPVDSTPGVEPGVHMSFALSKLTKKLKREHPELWPQPEDKPGDVARRNLKFINEMLGGRSVGRELPYDKNASLSGDDSGMNRAESIAKAEKEPDRW